MKKPLSRMTQLEKLRELASLPVSKPKPVPGDVMLKPSEVAIKLGVSENTIYRMAKKGTLTAHRLGRWPRYRLSEVEAYIEGGCDD